MKAFLKGFAGGLAVGLCVLAVLLAYIYFSKETDDAPQSAASQTNAASEETADMEPETAAAEPAEPADETVEAAEEALPEAPAETEDKSDALLAFAGDILFSDAYLSAYDQGGVSALADADMLSRMQGADLFIVNEEFPFSLRGEPMEDKQYTFRTDPKYVSIFQELGVDVASVANNHSLDYGREAFADTLETLDQAGIARIGGGYDLAEASSPAVCTAGGQTFAVFGATRVSPSYDWYATDSQAGLFQTYDPSKLNAAITEAAGTYDHVIVFVHWGVERSETPEDYQRELARGYIDAGADLVVGCHPHVLQGFEYYNGVPVVYSLGNYLFSNQTAETLLLEASFSADGAVSLQLVPCRRTGGVLTRISDPQSLYQHLTELSFGVTVEADGTLSQQEL